MPVKRIFVAFDISAEARQSAAEYIDRLRAHFSHCPASWTKPDKLHFTLRFLGDVDVYKMNSVFDAAAFAAARVGSAELWLEGTGVFPSPGKARVLWLGAKGDLETIAILKRCLDDRLQLTGFEADQKRFTPHLTLARVKDPNACGQMVESHLRSDFQTARFQVSEIVLYESKLQPAGSIYTALEHFKFAGPTTLPK